MPAKYIVKIKTYFAAAHNLRRYDGACSGIHGHNWHVEVAVEARKLDNLGMVIDYDILKEITEKNIKIVDHSYLNELEHFKDCNPTAENVAEFLYKNIQKDINNFKNSNDIKLKYINICETNTNYVNYSED